MKLVFLCIIMLILTGCTEQEPKSDEIFAMDTIISFKLYGDNTEEALLQMKDEIRRLDKKFSPENRVGNDPETEYIISTAEEINQKTENAFNICMAAVSELWGFRSKEYYVPKYEEIKVALETVQYDFGGIVKGYAGDRCREIAEEYEVYGIVSLGGNVQTIGKKEDKPWRVAVSDPERPDEIFGITEVSDKAVVTSGAYQRYFENNGKIYHHIIDPKTGCPAESDLLSATVICDSGIIADAYSTALFVMGSERGMEFIENSGLDIGAVMIKKDGTVVKTENVNFTTRKE